MLEHFEDHRPLLDRLAIPTPALVMDLAVVRSTISDFRAGIGVGADLRYAVKCNSTPRVLAAIAAAGCGFEIASAAELELAVNAGADPDAVVFSSPVKRSDHIATALQRGVRWFTVGSGTELDKLLVLGGPEVRPILRLRVPDRRSRWPQSVMFGMSVEDAVGLSERAALAGCDDLGLMFHVGSQAEPGSWTPALALAGEVLTASPAVFTLLDLGGGFPVSYPDVVASRLELWARIGAEIDDALLRLPYRPATIVAEPGRSLVADAGTLYTEVVDLDRSRQVVHTDAGAFNGLYETSAAGGGLGYHWRAFDRELEVTTPVRIGGISCDANDMVAAEVELPVDLAVGEWLAVRQTGAYSLSYAGHFCGLAPPTVVVSAGRDRSIPDYEVGLAGSPLFDEAAELEYRVFERAGFLEDDGSLATFRHYDPISRFLVTRTGDGRLGTAVRTVDASPMGFALLHKLPISGAGREAIDAVGLGRITEIVTLSSARPSLRSSLSGYAAIWFDIRARGRCHGVAGIDLSVLHMIERRLGNVAIRLGPPVDYLGSQTVAVLFDLGDNQEQPMRRSVLGNKVLDAAGHT